jgi:hypothetical protein
MRKIAHVIDGLASAREVGAANKGRHHRQLMTVAMRRGLAEEVQCE